MLGGQENTLKPEYLDNKGAASTVTKMLDDDLIYFTVATLSILFLFYSYKVRISEYTVGTG